MEKIRKEPIGKAPCRWLIGGVFFTLLSLLINAFWPYSDGFGQTARGMVIGIILLGSAAYIGLILVICVYQSIRHRHLPNKGFAHATALWCVLLLLVIGFIVSKWA